MVVIELDDDKFQFSDLKAKVEENLKRALKVVEAADFLAISQGQVDSPKVWVRISF